MDRWEQIRAFWWSTSSLCFHKTKWSLQRKEHLPYSQRWRRFSDVLRLLCCLWYWVPWMCAWHHEIRRLPRHFGAQCSTQCQKAGSPSKVMGLAAGQRPHTSKSTQEWFKTKRWTVLKWPAMNPNLNPIEHLWGDLKTAVGRRHPSNLGELEQFAQEEWVKLSVERWRKLIHGSRKHLTAVILSKGCDTKY